MRYHELVIKKIGNAMYDNDNINCGEVGAVVCYVKKKEPKKSERVKLECDKSEQEKLEENIDKLLNKDIEVFTLEDKKLLEKYNINYKDYDKKREGLVERVAKKKLFFDLYRDKIEFDNGISSISNTIIKMQESLGEIKSAVRNLDESSVDELRKKKYIDLQKLGLLDGMRNLEYRQRVAEEGEQFLNEIGERAGERIWVRDSSGDYARKDEGYVGMVPTSDERKRLYEEYEEMNKYNKHYAEVEMEAYDGLQRDKLAASKKPYNELEEGDWRALKERETPLEVTVDDVEKYKCELNKINGGDSDELESLYDEFIRRCESKNFGEKIDNFFINEIGSVRNFNVYRYHYLANKISNQGIGVDLADLLKLEKIRKELGVEIKITDYNYEESEEDEKYVLLELSNDDRIKDEERKLLGKAFLISKSAMDLVEKRKELLKESSIIEMLSNGEVDECILNDVLDANGYGDKFNKENFGSWIKQVISKIESVNKLLSSITNWNDGVSEFPLSIYTDKLEALERLTAKIKDEIGEIAYKKIGLDERVDGAFEINKNPSLYVSMRRYVVKNRHHFDGVAFGRFGDNGGLYVPENSTDGGLVVEDKLYKNSRKGLLFKDGQLYRNGEAIRRASECADRVILRKAEDFSKTIGKVSHKVGINKQIRDDLVAVEEKQIESLNTKLKEINDNIKLETEERIRSGADEVISLLSVEGDKVEKNSENIYLCAKYLDGLDILVKNRKILIEKLSKTVEILREEIVEVGTIHGNDIIENRIDRINEIIEKQSQQMIIDSFICKKLFSFVNGEEISLSKVL
ncbi:MAG: hypothetical protein LBC92_01315, partial [Rickettsiales bacterium]|nr:hypothetical protein [Rickettsiales bacterium]